MGDEKNVNSEKYIDPYKHGTAEELIENTQSVLETQSAGSGFIMISPSSKRTVEVRFIPDNKEFYEVGYVEKWSNSVLSIVVNNGSSENPEWKHHRVANTHNLGWRLINLNKE